MGQIDAGRSLANPLIEQVRAALELSPLVEIELYCERSGCAAREITIRAKDHDGTLVAMLERKGKGKCPVCGYPAKTHYAMTFAAAQLASDQAARMSVNTQRYMRDHGDCVPSHVLLDDSL